MNQRPPPRIYVIGTDTDVGKTACTCAMLLGLHARGLSVLPQKPVASGPEGPSSDIARLIAAVGQPLQPDELCSFRSALPKAPGLIPDAHIFLAAAPRLPTLPESPQPTATGDRPSTPTTTATTTATTTTTTTATTTATTVATRTATRTETRTATTLLRAQACLRDLITTYQPSHVLLEAAGGWHVPMPDGTWQSTWVQQLCDAILIVARPGLGTINHTLLTIQAARVADPDASRPILGFVFSSTQTEHTQNPAHLAEENAEVIQSSSGVPFLGLLPYMPALSDAESIAIDRERLVEQLAKLDVVHNIEHALRNLTQTLDARDRPIKQ